MLFTGLASDITVSFFRAITFTKRKHPENLLSHKKRRMRIVRRRVEDLKNRFEEHRIVNQQRRLVNENGKRTIVERMQE